MTPALKRIRDGLSNIIILGQHAIGRDSMPGSKHGLREIMDSAREQIQYLDSVQTTRV